MMETWKDIPGYEGKYSVSSFGRVMNIKRGNTLNPFDRAKCSHKMKKGYLTVHLVGLNGKYKNFSVHSLVMAAFVGVRPKGYVINHIDGNPSNNRLDNLEYCTQSHNRKMDFEKGRQSYLGEKNNSAKINSSDVLEIMGLRKNGLTYKQIANKYGLHLTGVSNIFNGHTWSHITGIEKRY